MSAWAPPPPPACPHPLPPLPPEEPGQNYSYMNPNPSPFPIILPPIEKTCWKRSLSRRNILCAFSTLRKVCKVIIPLSADLFLSGILPATDVGLSVTRVGSIAQWYGMKYVAGFYKLGLLNLLNYNHSHNLQLIYFKKARID